MCLRRYGFFSNPELPLWVNRLNAVASMDKRIYFSHPHTMAMHDLCTTISPPIGTKHLLGLGLKFCIERGTPNQKLLDGILRLRHSLRLREWLDRTHPFRDDETSGYIPGLYVNSDWEPPDCTGDTELALMHYGDKLSKLTKSISNYKRFNLDKFQLTLLDELKQDSRFIIWQADKNLGPCIIERPNYIRRCLDDHLLNAATYQPLTREQADAHAADTQDKLKTVLSEQYDEISIAEQTYFERSFKLEHRMPQFYCTAKVHKTPWSTRPVISCVGSFNEVFSKWTDYQLKRLLPLTTTYLKDSYEALADLRALGRLPLGAKIFTADAVSMYTNIDITHGVETFHKWLNEFEPEIPPDFPRELFLETLQLVMENNVFQFDDTYWLQKTGTAMGTSAACMYATLYYAYHERTVLIPKYGQNLHYFKRFIDDIFGIWIPIPGGPSWEDFLVDLDAFGLLRWTANPPSDRAIFLDLDISINTNNIIETKTYQKPMNLYLYIPPISAHPVGCLRGLVFGNLRRFWIQNTHREDYISVAKHFAERLIERGHPAHTIETLFMEAAKRFDETAKHPTTTPVVANANSLINPDPAQYYFHLEYHPRGIPRQEIRNLFDNTVGKHLPPYKFTIAYSRPKNLRDALMRTRMEETAGCRATDIINS